MRKRALAALLALSMMIPNGLGANIASAASSSTTITVNSMEDTTTDVSEVISGKVSSSKTITNVNYKATSEDGEVYAENAATVNGKKWSVDDLLLRPGENKIDITVKTSDGKKTTTSVNINYDNGSFEEVIEQETATNDAGEQQKFASEQILVMFGSDVSDDRCKEIIDEVGGKQIGVLYVLDEYQVQFSGANEAQLKKYIEKFEAYDEVIFAEFNYLTTVEAIPDDPWNGSDEWTESNPAGANWGMEAIHAVSAWDFQDKLSLNVDNKAAIKVGISDNGFDLDHEDLDIEPVTTSTAEEDHGTHVAGTICGLGNNGIGVTGVLGNADTIVQSSLSTSAVVNLIQNGAKVVNCSWGLKSQYSYLGASTGQTAANEMAKLLDAGYDFLVVQAAGNSYIDSIGGGYYCGITEDTVISSEYETTIEEVLDHKVIVANVQNKGANEFQLSASSNYGSNVDIAAPGTSIYSSIPNDKYGYKSGTSMAAPHVTGCLAYIWSLNPTLSAAEIKSLLVNNTSISVAENSTHDSGIDSYQMADLYLASKKALDRRDEGTVVYFDNSVANWSSVYAYVWSDGVEATVLPTTVVDSAKKIYKVTVPYNYKKIIFKNTKDSWNIQTGDLFVPTDENNCWKPNSSSNRASGSWYAYGGGTIVTPTPSESPTPVNYISFNYDNSKTNWSNVYVYAWVEGNSSVTPVIVKSVACVNNVYSFRVADTYKNILFKNTNSTSSWDKQTADTTLPTTYGYTFITDSGSNKTGGYWTTAPATTAPATTAPVTTVPVTPTVTPIDNTMFYYNNSKTSWSKVYAYVWADGVSAKTYEGTKVATNVYQFSVPKKYTKVLFKNTSGTSNWDKQTDDVLIKSTDGYIFVPNSSSNKTSGKWETYGGVTPTPVQTTAVPTETPIYQSYVTVDFNNSVHKWENVYAYVWNNTEDYKVFSASFVSGNHVLFNITGSYKYILFKNAEDGWDQQTADLSMPAYTTSVEDKCFTPYSAGNKSEGAWGKSDALSNRKAIVPSVSADKNTVAVGDTVNFTMKAQYENGHYLNSRSLTFVYEDGTRDTVRSSDYPSYARVFENISENTYTYSWSPSKTGKVRVIYAVNQYEDHGEDSQPITLDVKAESNTVKIYYKKSNWSVAYVHYKVDSIWTKVPGQKMQPSDRSDYAWMYTIDLGDTTSATLCFNNGNGSWDNNNSANYTVGTGVYGISGNTVQKLK